LKVTPLYKKEVFSQAQFSTSKVPDDILNANGPLDEQHGSLRRLHYSIETDIHDQFRQLDLLKHFFCDPLLLQQHSIFQIHQVKFLLIPLHSLPQMSIHFVRFYLASN
jgi:hypothetical protein